ncbi:hypothetical protein D3C75_350750 [compost metagenome]
MPITIAFSVAAVCAFTATGFACCFTKLGVSSMFTRSHRATAPNGRAIKNGIRQPQSCSASGVSSTESSATMPAPASRPSATVKDCQAPYNPRLPRGANSVISDTAPPYSPPANNPCRIRRPVMISGAAMPMLAYTGTSPMAAVARVINTSTIINVGLRPIRSPIRPKTMAPSGRKKKATAKEA